MSREAVLGRTTMDVRTWGEANSRILDDMTREMLKGGEAEVELQFEHGAGNVRHGLFWSRMCHGSDGQPACLVGTMVDITNIRRAEMLARETERRLFDVTRSLPAVVFQLRRTANGAYSFPYIGGDTRHLLGAKRRVAEQQRSGRISSACARRTGAFVLAELERSAHCETPVHMEFRLESEQQTSSGCAPNWCRAAKRMAASCGAATGWTRAWSARAPTNSRERATWPKRRRVRKTTSSR